MKQIALASTITLIAALIAGLCVGYAWKTRYGGGECSSIGGLGEQAEAAAGIKIYFIRSEGGQSYLEALTRQISKGETKERQAVEELVKGPQGENGLQPVLPPSTRILSLNVVNGTCLLDLSKEAITDSEQMNPSVTTERLALGAMANTLTEFPEICRVQLLIEGVQAGQLESGRLIEDFWGNIKLPKTMARDESLIGRRDTQTPAWSTINRNSLAADWGWRQVTRGNQSSLRLAFTFDGGSTDSQAKAILDTLAGNGITATFFLTGMFIANHPDTVRRIVDDGHEAGNHSYNHPNFVERPGESLKDQIAMTENAFAEFSSVQLKPYFRFPYGSYNPELLRQLNGLGYMSIYWTIDSLGWQNGKTAESVYNRVINNVSPGAIILMHMDSAPDAQALSGIIQNLGAKGYEFVSLTELLYPGP